MVILPDCTSAQAASPRLIDYGIWNTPVLGGTKTRTDRPGNRFGLKIDLPPTWTDDEGTALLSDLIAAQREGLRFTWPMGAFCSAPIGPAVVNGTDIQGTTLPLRGMLANTVIRKGQFFTITHDGDSFLHQNRFEVVIDAAGEGSLTIQPELRAILSDGDVCEFDEPFIEGMIEGEEREWSIRVDHFLEISLNLVEIA